jgi:hypothetical protein
MGKLVAIIAIRKQSELAWPVVLAPERYDPRRDELSKRQDGTPIGDIASIFRRVVSPKSDVGSRCMVLDTSDAREGVVLAAKPTCALSAVGSAKKLAAPGDVVISRLRPYLRQVAWLDESLIDEADTVLLLSTEFFVLRSRDGQPIGFLVPFLLSGAVQRVLAAAQEGGHHPRFSEAALLNLAVPRQLIEHRTHLSERVEDAVRLHRSSVGMMRRLISDTET